MRRSRMREVVGGQDCSALLAQFAVLAFLLQLLRLLRWAIVKYALRTMPGEGVGIPVVLPLIPLLFGTQHSYSLVSLSRAAHEVVAGRGL